MYYAPGAPTTSSADYNTVVTTMQVQVNYVVYLIAIVSLLGYILFAVFGGVGMFALPLDLIQGFFHRPRPISNEE